MNLWLIAIGGATGAVARAVLASAVVRVPGVPVAVGTAVVNLLGCLVFGLIAGAASGRVTLSPEARALLLTGLLGGFTTFSSYMSDSLTLWRDGQAVWALVNLAGQVLGGVLVFAAGWAAGLAL